ncbi:hypothetical protein SteCoe_1622 [Stentor coeruleus]|uniref:Uncharacterized protein n=1 Tax=Stentor coeruleus TaxID=5963 RepID=A0A1R2D1G5_9CILI|nr:hypothetical protein SteCoe_1622 [Stentor coeruleus]
MLTPDDLLDKLIADTLQKKPVNSEHFAIIRKVKPGEKFSKHPVNNEKDQHVPINRRIQDLMHKVGFSYGRLKEKNWVTDKSNKITRMVAPGPIIKTLTKELPKIQFDDKFKVKYPHGFSKPSYDKPVYDTSNSHSVDIKKPMETSTQRYLSQSPSQRQAKEYLQFLTAITSEEKRVLQTQIDSKKQDFKEELVLKVPREIKTLNNRGVFNTELNEIRANSMLDVKLKNQMKIKLEPIVRKVKAEVLREKMQDYNKKTEEIVDMEEQMIMEQDRKIKLLKYVGETISKNVVEGKDKMLLSTMYNSDHDWKDALNESITKMKAKCTPKIYYEIAYR